MAWVSVHQEVDGSKLRRLYKTIGCSKFEALGILNFLWFWGMKNADETGLVSDADLEVLSRYLYGCGEGSKLDMGKVVQALADVGWIDMAVSGFYIHDWDQWQEQWYKLQKNRKRDAERKRKDYAETVVQPREAAAAPPEEESAKKPSAKKKAEPEKKSYAEFVRMTEVSYNRLIELYGEPFTKACIERLDLYKGSKGKTYKDDYRAILSWVVKRVSEDSPGLMQMSRGQSAGAQSGSENPYAEWGESSE